MKLETYWASFSYHRNLYFKYLQLTPWKLSEKEYQKWTKSNQIASLFAYLKYRPLFLIRPRFYEALFYTYIKPIWKLMNEDMLLESLNSYTNAFKIAGIEYLDPYSYMKMAEPLDLNRIRNGEPKYMVRELFAKRYPTLDIPTKIPMPRAMNQWLKDYKVSRPEFIPNCTENMTGDQKWLCWCLEQFLNMHEEV